MAIDLTSDPTLTKGLKWEEGSKRKNDWGGKKIDQVRRERKKIGKSNFVWVFLLHHFELGE